MASELVTRTPQRSAQSLRVELNARACAWARARSLTHELTTGRSPSVIFGQDAQGGHGNFLPASYQAICARPDWQRRLRKAHTASLRALPRADWHWRELDSASSSDALLMNIFCHPQTLQQPTVAALLGIRGAARPLFGVRPRVPLRTGLADATELDMQIDAAPGGATLFEAKLTETDFQTARPALVERYRDLDEVFDTASLPRTRALIVAEEWNEEQASMVPIERGAGGNFASYQLIRGTLAAHSTGAAFCVLLDGRRFDLVEAWHGVQQAVRPAELRCRLQLLTWQEIAGALPCSLQAFLAEKYGIEPA